MNELISIFNGKQIRKIRFKGEWWFSVLDIIASVVESDPLVYWQKVKNKQIEQIVEQLKLTAVDGKKYPTDCVTSEGIFRIIQSIPSSKAEPFKCWLAKVAAERLDEMEDPELGIIRVLQRYRKETITER